MAGKGTTNTANIESALLSFKQEVITVTKKWQSPKYVKLDGETGLINAAKVLGPETRRIVERNHALRRLEQNIVKGPLKDNGEDQALFLKLWDRFCDSRSYLDADVMRKQIRKMFEDHPGYETIMKHLQIYFDDPQIICYYGRSDMSKELLLKHQGPAEVEGFFDKLKHDYTNSRTEYMKTLDIIIHNYKEVKDSLRTRFLNDFQNSKLPDGIKEVVKRYKAQFNIDIIPPSPRKPRPTIVKAGKRKSPRKSTDSDMEPPAKKKKSNDARRNLNDNFEETEETDMNIPFEEQLNQGAISTFSKSKKKRNLQRNILMKTHKNKIDLVMKEVDKTIDTERSAATIDLDIPSSQFETIDFDDSDFNFNQLLAKVNDEGPHEVSKLMLTDSETKPDFEVWKTLAKIDDPESLDSIPYNTYFDIPSSSSVNSPLSHILEQLLPEDDTTTAMKQTAFRYLFDSSNDITYLCIMIMTNKAVRRQKMMPFIIQIMIPFGTVQLEDSDSTGVHIHHVIPREKTFSEDLMRVKLVGSLESGVRNTLVKTFKRNFPPEVWTDIKNFNQDSKAEPYDLGIAKNSLAVVRIESVKNPVLVKVITFNAEKVLIEILKPEKRSTLKWNTEKIQTKWFPRTSLLATNIPALTSEKLFHLNEKPSVILKNLGVDK